MPRELPPCTPDGPKTIILESLGVPFAAVGVPLEAGGVPLKAGCLPNQSNLRGAATDSERHAQGFDNSVVPLSPEHAPRAHPTGQQL